MAFATFSHFALFFPGKFPGEAKSFFKKCPFSKWLLFTFAFAESRKVFLAKVLKMFRGWPAKEEKPRKISLEITFSCFCAQCDQMGRFFKFLSTTLLIKVTQTLGDFLRYFVNFTKSSHTILWIIIIWKMAKGQTCP